MCAVRTQRSALYESHRSAAQRTLSILIQMCDATAISSGWFFEEPSEERQRDIPTVGHRRARPVPSSPSGARTRRLSTARTEQNRPIRTLDATEQCNAIDEKRREGRRAGSVCLCLRAQSKVNETSERLSAQMWRRTKNT